MMRNAPPAVPMPPSPRGKQSATVTIASTPGPGEVWRTLAALPPATAITSLAALLMLAAVLALFLLHRLQKLRRCLPLQHDLLQRGYEHRAEVHGLCASPRQRME